MIASVVREYKWSPDIIGDLFFDAEDYFGLVYWYNDIEEIHKDFKAKNK